jgi:hypothetical protein
VPEVRGQGVSEPGVDVGLDVPAGSPGQLVARGFVPVAGLGLLQGVELAQRLELVGAGRDPLRLAYGGLAVGGGAAASSWSRAPTPRAPPGRGRRRPGPRGGSFAVRRSDGPPD